MSRPVLILFANLKGNLGDFAILHSMLEEIGRRHPEAPVHVMSHGQHGIDESRFAAFRRSAPAFEYLGRTPFRRVSRILSVFKRLGMGKRLARHLIEKHASEFATLAPASTAAQYQSVYFAGGEQWSGYSNGIAQLAMLHAIHRQNTSLSLFPFSVKQRLLDTYDDAMLRESFGFFGDHLVNRDSHSAETMRKIHPNVRLGADCVLALAGLGKAVEPMPGDSRPITIALTTGNGSRKADVHAMVLTLIAAGHQLRFLTTCEREDGDDMEAIGQALGIECLKPQTWQEAVAGFRSSSMVVTNRLHCMIFTLFAQVPLVPMLNREKVRGITGDARLPHFLEHSAELTPDKVDECLRDRDSILVAMADYLGDVATKDLAP